MHPDEVRGYPAMAMLLLIRAGFLKAEHISIAPDVAAGSVYPVGTGSTWHINHDCICKIQQHEGLWRKEADSAGGRGTPGKLTRRPEHWLLLL